MSDESKGAVTVYETTPRYRIEVSGHSGQPEHPIPRQMVSKDDYDALAARLAAAEARVAEVEGERDRLREEACRWYKADGTYEVLDSPAKAVWLRQAAAKTLAKTGDLAAANAAQAREIERLRGIVDRLPKTADGVPIVPGMVVYPEASHAIEGEYDEDGEPIVEGEQGATVEAFVAVRLRENGDVGRGEPIELGEDEMGGLYAAPAPAADASGEVTP